MLSGITSWVSIHRIGQGATSPLAFIQLEFRPFDQTKTRIDVDVDKIDFMLLKLNEISERFGCQTADPNPSLQTPSNVSSKYAELVAGKRRFANDNRRYAYFSDDY